MAVFVWYETFACLKPGHVAKVFRYPRLEGKRLEYVRSEPLKAITDSIERFEVLWGGPRGVFPSPKGLPGRRYVDPQVMRKSAPNALVGGARRAPRCLQASIFTY